LPQITPFTSALAPLPPPRARLPRYGCTWGVVDHREVMHGMPIDLVVFVVIAGIMFFFLIRRQKPID